MLCKKCLRRPAGRGFKLCGICDPLHESERKRKKDKRTPNYYTKEAKEVG